MAKQPSQQHRLLKILAVAIDRDWGVYYALIGFIIFAYAVTDKGSGRPVMGKHIWTIICKITQSGCCKPPSDCGFSYVNETVWASGAGGVAYNTDCSNWSNDQEQLCYSCNSCKAGVLGSLKKSWRKVSVINIIVLIILVIVYVIGCAAFRNNRRIDNDEPYGEARMTKAQPSRIHL
ncbi:hypothetical protein GH714_003273 [Hevea brasiliensis]|uniref:Uncharacterized protein n=1 Tax=Hevea brasiliensis TaxID=3981 RepID=A0A6A6N6R3_HEVBR|nr:hypothetical protein GH714_003273 [Hevea brasiliensis]